MPLASDPNGVPAAYARVILDAAARRGADPAALLRATGVTREQIDRPGFRLTARASAQVVENAVAHGGDPGLGLALGLETKPVVHGYLGFAAMSCNTLGEAVELVLRFVRLQLHDVELEAVRDGSVLALVARDRIALGAVHAFVHECLIAGLYQMATSLLHDYSPDDAEIWFDWDEPDYFARFRDRLPRTRFAMPSIQLRFAADYLAQPLRLGDPESRERSVEECERELLALGLGPDDVVGRVRSLLAPSGAGFPACDAVAARLGLSGRTLKRRLKARGHGFRALLDEARFREASRLLANPDVDVQQVAASLGYSDPSCFTRAFRRWSGGATPSQARRGAIRTG